MFIKLLIFVSYYMQGVTEFSRQIHRADSTHQEDEKLHLKDGVANNVFSQKYYINLVWLGGNNFQKIEVYCTETFNTYSYHYVSVTTPKENVTVFHFTCQQYAGKVHI